MSKKKSFAGRFYRKNKKFFLGFIVVVMILYLFAPEMVMVFITPLFCLAMALTGIRWILFGKLL